MDYVLHLQPTFDCLLKAKNIEMELTKHKIYSFLCNSENTMLSFYPTYNQNSQLPFTYVFNVSNIKKTKNVTITKFPKNNYHILVTPFFLINQNPLNLNILKVELNKKSHKIYYLEHSDFSIKVQNEDNFITGELPVKILDLNTKIKDNNLLIYCKTELNKFVIMLVRYENNNYELLKLEEVEQLEINENKIKTYKKLHDFAGHGEITIYNFSSVFNFETSLVYNDNLPIYQKSKELIPYAFFDALKVKNYKLARTYLTDDLSSVLTDNALKNYFGNFIDISSPLSSDVTFNEVALIYSFNENYQIAKVFNIELNEQNKITNIKEN